MESVPVWVFFIPVVGFVMGPLLIIFRKRFQRDVVAIEKKIGLPKLMRLDAFSDNGGATLVIGIGFIVIAVLQVVVLITQL
ncbi:hypothetical protein FEF26_15110 [Nesterenkonia salmonea]|uniref:Uncharacterized protein n=1 Tax=Nesterenkonia salmonea TaxID=1804987 RepID=A0A5R9B6W6_9MICC|nr:hypothetical protein [Nesterenkonia salmonea]TLP92116.1 hypothetical protein FEF26_15110 [Nesterenkonia salmonea]